MLEEDDFTEIKAVIGVDGLDTLISVLEHDGHEVIGPRQSDHAIIFDRITSSADLPAGWLDEQNAGSYRLVRAAGDALFAHVVGPHSWKRYLYPPTQKLWHAEKTEHGMTVVSDFAEERKPYAFLGVRACELAAMRVQDKVFGYDPIDHPDGQTYVDPGYADRRRRALIVAVNCGRAASTCFCVSMDTGPKAKDGYDLALTELTGDSRHEFLVEVGSRRGRALLGRLPHRPVEIADTKAAKAAVARAVAQNRRALVPEAAAVLKANRDHTRWDEVAKRCLSCANCTMVCPTCFCSTMEDSTVLDGSSATRTRKWDSCFTMDFSYIHGGSVRRETRSRYRQWMTHKLSTWHEQFGTSGCTGCGRCIAWCPVGIDITEETRAIRDSQQGQH